MGSTESTTVTHGQPPPEMVNNLVRRTDGLQPPFLAPRFEPYNPKTLYKIECPISINPRSVTLCQSSGDPEKLGVCFKGKCLKPSSLQIFSFVREETDANLVPIKHTLLPTTLNDCRPQPPIIPILPNGEFSYNSAESGVCVFSLSDIQQNPSNLKERWSLILRLSVDAPDPICVNTLQVYCAIRVISGVAKLKVVTQKCVVQNRGYFMSELYGLGDMSKEEGEGRECVICMTNDRDTCVMPCRHVCCCAECANTLRLQSDRCPVCREAITELVYLTVNPDYLNAQRDQSGTLNVEMNSLGS